MPPPSTPCGSPPAVPGDASIPRALAQSPIFPLFSGDPRISPTELINALESIAETVPPQPTRANP